MKIKYPIHGHRGCRGLAPENTLFAFNKAASFPIEMWELDVICSGDGKWVVSHDPFPNGAYAIPLTWEKKEHTSIKQAYNFFKMPYEKIKEIDCGSVPHPLYPEQELNAQYKPLLEEVVQLAKKYKIGLNIELKSHEHAYGIFQASPEVYASSFLKFWKEQAFEYAFIFQSFDKELLKHFHALDSSLPLYVLSEEDIQIEVLCSELGFKPQGVGVLYKKLTKKSIVACKQQGVKVLVWTVNRPLLMKTMFAWGVDGLITDFPNIAVEAYEEFLGLHQY